MASTVEVVSLAMGPASIEEDQERVAQHAAYFFGHEGGVQPGAWVNNLLVLIAHADLENRERLRLVFPEHVAAMERERLLDGPLRIRPLPGATS